MLLVSYWKSATLTSISVSTWHAELQHAFYQSEDLKSRVSLVPYEMNCGPHYPFYGLPDLNFENGTKSLCEKERNKVCAACKKIVVGNSEGYSLWISGQSVKREGKGGRRRKAWERKQFIASCRRPEGRFYAAEVFLHSDRTSCLDIPIPTFTFAHDAYPETQAQNLERCMNVSHVATFKGYGGNSPERMALKQHVDRPGYVIEYNDQYGGEVGASHATERMAHLLRDSHFGLAPAGDGWHSYRLMEIMAMGTVPVILSDEWSLPFEDILNWSEFSIRVQLSDIGDLPSVLDRYTREDACKMSSRVFEVYHQYFANASQIMKGIENSVNSCLEELELP
jgi:hypothetical protein